MKPLSWPLFILLLAVAAIFEIRTTPDLPPLVASHFDYANQANGFMSRDGYLRFMLIMTVGLPLGLVTLLAAMYSRAPYLKIPNAEYWLNPARMAQTRERLTIHTVWLGCLLVTSMAYVHWMLVDANHVQPPLLSSSAFKIGAALFLGGIAVWMAAFALMFSVRSR